MDADGVNRGLDGVAVTETRLSTIDGDAGELIIRGFPVEELATNATFEETIFLLFHDRLPDAEEHEAFRADLASRREICDEVRGALRRAAEEDKPAMDALRMGAAAANLGTEDGDPESDAHRVIAAFPTIVAAYWRYRQGEIPVDPDPELGHAANYLYMLTDERPDEAAVRGLETYLNAVVDHGLNAST
ncbi:MAG: citrate/2-methylcitrate synthase, partial [Halapricum sp.]